MLTFHFAFGRESVVTLATLALLVLQALLVLKAPWAPLANMETVVNLYVYKAIL